MKSHTSPTSWSLAGASSKLAPQYRLQFHHALYKQRVLFCVLVRYEAADGNSDADL